jgi:hypothetical protein
MDPAELYEAYASGGISRRAFVARLTAFGVTAAVAAAYANTVAAEEPVAGIAPSTVGANGDLYALYDLYDPGDLYNNPGN